MKRSSMVAMAAGFSALVFLISVPGFSDPADSNDPSSQSVMYDGSQADYSFILKNEVDQTVYENKDVPDTCYRTVPDGTETQCHVETHPVCGPDIIRHVCENTTRQECTPVVRQQCGPVTRQECSITNRRECREENHPVCSPVSRQVCSPVSHQECRPVSHQECSTRQVCRPGPRGPVCSPEQECRDVTQNECREVTQNECRNVIENQCRNVPEQVCQIVPERECRDVTQNECRNVTDQDCRSVPETVCHDDRIPNCQDVSHNVCVEVPKTREEAYACTKSIQVPVGTNLVSSDVANVAMHFDSSAGTTAEKVAEQYICSLENGSVDLKLEPDSAPSFLLFGKVEQKAVSIDDKHRQITATIQVRGVDLAEAERPLTLGVEDVTLTESSLQFSLGQISAPELLKLTIQINKADDGSTVVGAQNLDLSKARITTTAGGRSLVSVNLSQLGVPAGKVIPGNYQILIGGTLAISDRSDLLNPAALNDVPALSESLDASVPVGTNELTSMTAGGIQNLSMDGSVMNFTLGLVPNPDFLTMHVKVQKDILWGLFHDTKFDDTIPESDIHYDNSTGVSKVSIDLATFIDMSGGTYEVDLTVGPNADALANLLTPDQINSLQTVSAPEQKIDL